MKLPASVDDPLFAESLANCFLLNSDALGGEELLQPVPDFFVEDLSTMSSGAKPLLTYMKRGIHVAPTDPAGPRSVANTGADFSQLAQCNLVM